ncbi:hypothetical protein BCV70DRAFT_3267 [Testicularia cyperi]|uniref:Uncharacterized protein n=1 Tax=Testicularia cyperi TaxID=1882483 RepID=A0A317XZ94_9BASI|nr:hypothetical protein BCV70DRAFT_3267 [Testicularia cyperi]
MLAPPQPSFASRAETLSSGFARKNTSMASFTSSSNDHDPYSSRSVSVRNSQSGSSRDHIGTYFDTQPPINGYASRDFAIDDSSDVEYQKPSTKRGFLGSVKKQKNKTDVTSSASSGAQAGSNMSNGGGGGALRSLGRRLFNRSNTNLSSAPVLASRSHSASSASVGSPPLTPTTPPVQPVWLPNGQKDFFSSLSGLPSKEPAAIPAAFRSMGEAANEISPKTLQDEFRIRQSPIKDTTPFAPDTSSSIDHDSSSTFSHQSSIFSLPTMPRPSAAPSAFSSDTVRREIPTVIEEEGDSDFLRAVLNFGDGYGDIPSASTASFRGGRAAPLPTRSSSLGQIADITDSPHFSPSVLPPPRRATDGRVILTQEAAREYAAEKATPSYTIVHRKKFRKGLFARNDSESEDEYGADHAEDDSVGQVAAASPQLVASPASVGRPLPSQYPSSFAKVTSRSQSRDSQIERSEDQAGRLQAPTHAVGLNTPSKKALYACTLLKVHMHLAQTLADDPGARTQIPIIAGGGSLYSNEELRFPRSINPQSRLRAHSTTYSFIRDLRVALGRTEVMRKLRRDRLRIDEEVEISWFQRSYGTGAIAPEHIAKALRQRQNISPEALAKPPIAAPEDSAMASRINLDSSRRLSGISNLEPGQRIHSDAERNGIVAWAQRPSFQLRMSVILPVDEFMPGEILHSHATKLAEDFDLRRELQGRPQNVSYSPRIRVLAGLPSVQEERRLKYPATTKFRPRDLQSKRASQLDSTSEPGVWEGPSRRPEPRRREASAGSVRSGRTKRLPPWMTPSSTQMLSPQSASLTLPRASASEVSLPVSMYALQQNSSSASIPEAPEPEETADAASSDDEEVPLAQLQSFRAQKTAEREKIQQLQNEISLLKLKEAEREREEVDRKKREEEARRIEVERAYEERKAAAESRKLEKNRKLLQEARERRGFTRQSVLLAEPNYGAGNPLLNTRSPAKQPSSPNLSQAASPEHKAIQHSDSFAQLTGENSKVPRSLSGLYALPEGQRSRNSVLPPTDPGAVLPASVRPAPASPQPQPLLTDAHRQSSMATLSPPQPRLSQRASMNNLPTSPQISQRRTSLKPPGPDGGLSLQHAVSMQHLASPTSPMMPASQSAFLHPDPRHSMSMTNLHAQAYLQAQAQAQAQAHAQAQAQMMAASQLASPRLGQMPHAGHALSPQLQQMQHPQHLSMQRPTQAQTVKVSSRMRPNHPPLVSLYGNVVPSSAMQRQT